jgi:hypothetical protein
LTSITTWEASAEATLTGQDSAGRMGRELAAQTEPVALAKRARHRRPKAWRRPLLPLWAGALVLAFQALHEVEAAAKTQQGGAS